MFMMEYPDDLNPKSMIAGFMSYVDQLLIYCLQVSIRNCIQTHTQTLQSTYELKTKGLRTYYIYVHTCIEIL